MDELVRWLGEQLDEDELWAVEASRRDDGLAAEGGVHWHWVAGSNDEEIPPDPGREKVVGSEAEETVSLRSREKWPTASGVGDLPQFALYADEVLSTVGGHIIRHDPARVLREIDAKRRILAECAHWHGKLAKEVVDPSPVPFPALGEVLDAMAPILRALALPYADRTGYREDWRP